MSHVISLFRFFSHCYQMSARIPKSPFSPAILYNVEGMRKQDGRRITLCCTKCPRFFNFSDRFLGRYLESTFFLIKLSRRRRRSNTKQSKTWYFLCNKLLRHTIYCPIFIFGILVIFIEIFNIINKLQSVMLEIQSNIKNRKRNFL